MNLLHRLSMDQSVMDVVQAVRIWSEKVVSHLCRFDVPAPQGLPSFQRPESLEQGFLEGAADGHHLPYGFHLGAERSIGLRKFLKIPLRDLDHDVVNRRLKAGR